MSDLEMWLSKATRGLAADSAAQVRREIGEHYESAREAAIAVGCSEGEAEKTAFHALGDAKTANCQYREVLLTAKEARALGEGKWEERAICSRPWLKWLIISIPVVLVEVAAVLYFRGELDWAKDLLLAGVGISPAFVALLVPIDTQLRGRLFRVWKWVAITGALVLLCGPNALKWSWLLIVTFGPMAVSELTRASIRRKLPASEWPRHLYL